MRFIELELVNKEMRNQGIPDHLNRSVWRALKEDIKEDCCPSCGNTPEEGIDPECWNKEGCGYWKQIHAQVGASESLEALNQLLVNIGEKLDNIALTIQKGRNT